MSEQRANSNQFVFIVDTVPDWWRSIPGVLVDVSAVTAILPDGTRIAPGDLVTRSEDGSIMVQTGSLVDQARASKVLTDLLLDGSAKVVPAGDGPIGQVDSVRTVNE
jgi:hypothetical protein